MSTESKRVPERTLESTPAQTIGPFFAYGTEFDKMHEVAFPHSPGAIVVRGRVLDGAGAPVPDCMIEIFGADEDGSIPAARGTLRRNDHTFTGFGRAFTSDEGEFTFWTRLPGSKTRSAPFYAVVLYARGLTRDLHTRIYPPLSEREIEDDPFLSTLSPAERSTLIAKRSKDGVLSIDLRLQGGDDETVFLAF